MSSPATLLEALRRYADERSRQVAYRFLVDGEVDGSAIEWTFEQLYAEVRSVAAAVRDRMPAGSRCLLLFPSGPDFIAGFLGCLWAGVVAVPAYLPDSEQAQPRALRRMLGVLRDCGASGVLTAPDDAGLSRLAADLDPAFADLAWLRRAEVTAQYDGPVDRVTPAGDVAFLQYTSGSTGDPKGVMVSHENLMHNLGSQRDAWRQDAASVVSWLPSYHDMGLIAGLLYPLFVGGTATFMTPTAFIERPARWLRAISHFKGAVSLAPNFGYELCVRRISDADLSGLDLSSWAVAVNGAEPVRESTARAFADRFAAAGFDPRAVVLGYGLAEATLFVTSTRPGQWSADRSSTSCGAPALDTKVLVVDPDSAKPVPEGQVGEIWVQSLGNALGYWRRPADTADTFQARLANGEGPYLRTGDLGTLDSTGLRICGRLKDLIVVDGVNHYPQDIEQTVEDCHPAVRSGCVAAFGVDVDGSEQVVVVGEVTEGSAELSAVLAAVRAAVLREHSVPVHEVVLIRPRTIPKTSSGKIQRRETAARYAAGELSLCTGRQTPVTEADAAVRLTGPAQTRVTVAGIRAWLRHHLSNVTGVPVHDVRTTEPFDRYGLDSPGVVTLAKELGKWLGRPVDPTDVYGNPTVDALAHYVTGAEVIPARSTATTTQAKEAVAIVGIGCRFPGADGPAAYWSLLSNGVEAIRDVPARRWEVEDFYQAGGPAPGKMYTRRGGFIDEPELFDAAFFGLPEAEARYLDPQQRLLLEMAWAAMEDAGTRPADLAGSSTGVYIGLTTGDYAQMMAAAGIGTGPYAATGNVACMAANRLSYTFDLRGPSITIDTACSSSLVAIHQACAAIRAGEIDTALTGGVNLMLSPLTTVALCQSGALSPDGRCYTFDARANGYVRGEGAGLVLLKPLSRALADNDRVYAVIRGSAVNQDGRSNGLTAPNPQAHAQAIRRALRDAELGPERVQYVEAHGTGTALGDPIEAAGVGAVLGGARPEERCAIGSVKTNFGHLEAAAGVAGLIKVALALHHRQLPPSLHHETTNPQIDLNALGLRVPDSLEAWPSFGDPRVGSVNSFGVGGTNAHVVLEETAAAAVPDEQSTAGLPRLLVLSGRTPSAVADLSRRFADFLPSAEAGLDAVCATAGLRREHHEYRLAAVAPSAAEMADRLGEGTAACITGRARPEADARIVFVFPGQGAQHIGMARGLYANDQAFRAAFDECESYMRSHLSWSPKEQLHADEPDARLDEEQVVQPLLFAIQVSLAATWRDRGVRPDAVLGHSMGEVAAAYVAGALDLATAVELTCVRARLLADSRGQGAMAVVGLHHESVRAELAAYNGRLHLAAANGPALSVVSGDKDAVDAFRTQVQERGVFARAVRASGAGHSPAVEPAATEIGRRFAGLRAAPARVPLYSSVTGAQICGDELTGAYWGRNLRDTVLFLPAVEQLAASGHRLFLEMSPNPTLVVPVQQALDECGVDGRAIGSLVRGRDDRVAILEAFGALHANGGAVDLAEAVPSGLPPTTLPTAPWQRRSYWFSGESETSAATDVAKTVADAFAGVLRVTDLPPNTNFFELGGTSLMAAQMLYDLRSRLQRDIPLRMLFENPTVTAFTSALESQQPANPSLSPLTRTESVDHPLTFVQERCVVMDPDPIATHLLLEGPLDATALDRALQRVVEIHDGLSTVFTRDETGTTRQRIARPTRPAPILSYTDLSAMADPQDHRHDQQEELRTHLLNAERPFQVYDGPRYRFELVRLAEKRHVLSIVVHHIVTDGYSQAIILRDLKRAYEAAIAGRTDDLTAPELRLIDYASWERAVYSGDVLDERIDFWRDRLRNTTVPRLSFLSPPSGGSDLQAEIAVLSEASIDEATLTRLEDMVRTASLTMPILIFTAFLLAIRRYSGVQEVSVQWVVSGRDQPGLEDVVGWFSTQQLVTADFSGGPTWQDCLYRVRDAMLKSADEQGFSFAKYAYMDGLVNEDLPFRIFMNYIDERLPEAFGEARVKLLPQLSEFGTKEHDVMLVVAPAGRSLRLMVFHSPRVVGASAMKTFLDDVISVLDGILENPDKIVY